MRTVAGSELTLLGASHTNLHLKVEVQDADAAWKDLTTLGGVDWVDAATWNESIDRPVSTGTVELRRDTSTPSALSLAPFLEASPLNVDALSAYAPLLEIGRGIRISTALTIHGEDPNGNFALNPGLEAGTGANWTLGTNWTVQNTNARTGTWALKHTAGGVLHNTTNLGTAPVVAGDQMYAEAYLKGTGGADGGVGISIVWFDGSMTVLSASASGAPASDGAYHVVSVTGTAPASAAFASVRVGILSQTVGTWYADDFVLRRANLWKEMFLGRIDDIDWQANPIRVQISDLGAWIMDAFIEAEGVTYGGASSLEVNIQDLLDDVLGVGVVTLSTPVASGWNVTDYVQERKQLLVALQDLAMQIAWDARYRYDASDVSRFTLYEPQRSKTTADATIGPDVYRDVTQLRRSLADIRNVVKVVYQSSSGIFSVTRSNTASIAKYRRRYMEIREFASNIDTGTEATSMGQGAVDDLSEPIADQEIELSYWWPVQLGDLLEWTANGDHYDVNQKLAVVSTRHDLRKGSGTTTIQTRGSVAGAYRRWLQTGGGGTGGAAPPPNLFGSLTQTPDYALDTVTFGWTWDGDPSVTFNLFREENATGASPTTYVKDAGSPFTAGTSSFIYSTVADIDATGSLGQQANIGFYVEAILGTTVIAASVEHEVVYNRN